MNAIRVSNPDTELASIIDELCEYFNSIHANWNDPEEPLAISLWVLHTWFIRSYQFEYEYTFYLNIISHDAGCGKSSFALALMDVCSGAKGMLPTVARMKRFLMNPENRVMIIDQYHNLGNAKSTDKEQLNGILASGWSPGFPWEDSGLDGNPVSYDVYFPKAMFGLSKYVPQGDERERMLRIVFHKRSATDAELASNSVKNVSPKVIAQEIKTRIASWVNDKTATVLNSRMIELGQIYRLSQTRIYNREADNWRMLIALADMAGTVYAKRIREYAERMTVEHPDPSETDISEASRIDVALLKLMRTHVLPVDNFNSKLRGRSPVSDHESVMIQPSELGWPHARGSVRGKLRTITLLTNDKKREANLRIPVSQINEIAEAIGSTRDDIINAYRNANRLHKQSGRYEVKGPFYSGQKDRTDRMYIIDFTPIIYGIDYQTTDHTIRSVNRILESKTEDELWDAM